MHRITLLQSGKPITDRRPFEDYRDQPDTAERVRLQVQAIPWALPEKKEEISVFFRETRVREMKYEGAPVAFRLGGDKCP